MLMMSSGESQSSCRNLANQSTEQTDCEKDGIYSQNSSNILFCLFSNCVAKEFIQVASAFSLILSCLTGKSWKKASAVNVTPLHPEKTPT